MSSRLIDLIENLPRVRVALLGDFMLDRYLYGNAERLSPEAPVPVLHFQHEEIRLGGAGSVAANLATLRADVTVFGTCGGGDAQTVQLRELLQNLPVRCDGLITDSTRPTTCKMRLVGSAQHRHPQQLLRLDFEDNRPVSAEVSAQIVSALGAVIQQFQVICIEDYNKGVVTTELCQQVIRLAREANIPDSHRPCRPERIRQIHRRDVHQAQPIGNRQSQRIARGNPGAGGSRGGAFAEGFTAGSGHCHVG